MQNELGNKSNEKVCVRCRKPAKVEKRTTQLNEYMGIGDGQWIAERHGDVESVIYLCDRCTEKELAVK